MNFIYRNLLLLWGLIVFTCVVSLFVYFGAECKPPDPESIINFSEFTCKAKNVSLKVFTPTFLLSIVGGILFYLHKKS